MLRADKTEQTTAKHEFRGCGSNTGGREVKVQSDSVDDAFVGRVTEFVRKISPYAFPSCAEPYRVD